MLVQLGQKACTVRLNEMHRVLETLILYISWNLTFLCVILV